MSYGEYYRAFAVFIVGERIRGLCCPVRAGDGANQTVEAAVSDWVTGIVFQRLSVSVKSSRKDSAVRMHVMRSGHAPLRKPLQQARGDGARLSPGSNWHKGEGIKLAEIQTAAT